LVKALLFLLFGFSCYELGKIIALNRIWRVLHNSIHIIEELKEELNEE
jgi:hypothetical protein